MEQQQNQNDQFNFTMNLSIKYLNSHVLLGMIGIVIYFPLIFIVTSSVETDFRQWPVNYMAILALRLPSLFHSTIGPLVTILANDKYLKQVKKMTNECKERLNLVSFSHATPYSIPEQS